MSEQAKKVHHLSKDFKPMLEDGLIDEKGYYTKKYNEINNIVETVDVPNYSAAQVNEMMQNLKREILGSIPSGGQSQPIGMQNVMINKNYDIADEIPELKNWELKAREYRLVDNQKPIWRDIQRAHNKLSPLQYVDKITGKSFAMRYTSNQSSFFIENQSKEASEIVDGAISFEWGTLKLGVDQTKLQQFLHIHKHNGTVFIEYDYSKIARQEIADSKAKAKAFSLIDTVGKLTNRAIVALDTPNYIEAWTDDQIEASIYKLVELTPLKYIAYCEDPTIKIKGVIKSSIAKGFLVYKNYKFYDEQMAIIIDVPRDKNEIDEMATHLMSGDGRTLYDYLVNKN